MKEYKVPVQSLIDHIKTAVDVDPWAKEMAEELLKEQPQIVMCKDCKHLGYTNEHWFCKLLNRCVDDDWYCADGEKRE